MRRIQTEPRDCKECGQTYEWNLRNIYGLCSQCRKRHYVKLQRLKPFEYKKPYPLNPNEKRSRYKRIVKDLDKAETAEGRREVYRRELEYMIQTGIWEWCNDIRFSTKTIDVGSGKRGRKPKKDTRLPNTKDWNDEGL